MKFRFVRIPGRYAAIAFFVGVVAGAGIASATPAVVVSDRVCDPGASSTVRAPEPGEVRCSIPDIPAGRARVQRSIGRGESF